MLLHSRLDAALGLTSDAPVVVMLGSLGSTLDMWQPQALVLSAHARVVRLDHRGHGGSEVPPTGAAPTIADLAADVLETLDSLGVQRFSVVGLSLGGMIAQYLGHSAPERVERVVALCTAAQLGPASGWTDRAAAVREGGTESIAEAVVGRWFSEGYAAEQPALVTQMRAMVASVSNEGYAQCCEAIAVMDQRADLPRISAPLLAIAGADDPATPPAMLREIADAAGAGSYAQVAPAAHLANVEQAEAVNALLLEFLGFGANANGQEGRSRGGLSDAERFEQGMRVRREVLGDAHVDRSAPTPFTDPFQNLITRYAWGDIWSRPGLSRRDRSLIVLGVLTALGQEHELAMHVRVAYENNGLTPDEIGEVILQTGIYAGVPTANRGFAIAQQVLSELGAFGRADSEG
ncbi:3-oxoadipate enol-lactonase [Micrococcales bacterium 31B]|nr:3-oxoadipate enol-lactonase [Micrococcales bacterium 31B]